MKALLIGLLAVASVSSWAGINLNCETTNKTEKPTFFEDPTETRLLCKDQATQLEAALLIRGIGVDIKLKGKSLNVVCSTVKSVDELIYNNNGYFADAESLRSAEFKGRAETGNCQVKGAPIEVKDEPGIAALSFWEPGQLFE